MLPENRIPTHPGEILLEEFLIPLELSQVAFARHIGVPVQCIINEYDLARNRPARQIQPIAAAA
jgi:hypothetical protein